MKVNLIKIEDSEVVVPLTLKVPKRLYDRLERLVSSTKQRQDAARKKAIRELKGELEVGQLKGVPRKASKQSILLSIIESALYDPDFKVEIESA